MNHADQLRAHEAGHCVLGEVLGLATPHLVHAFGDAEAGSARWLDEMHLDDRGIEGHITGALAGIEAARVLGAPDPDLGGDQDVAFALMLAGLISKQPALLVARLREQAHSLALHNRHVIERFAETLRVNRGRLAGDEVATALQAALNGWPTPDFFDTAAGFRTMVRIRERFDALVSDADTAAQRSEKRAAAEWFVRSGQVDQPVPSFDEHVATQRREIEERQAAIAAALLTGKRAPLPGPRRWWGSW